MPAAEEPRGAREAHTRQYVRCPLRVGASSALTHRLIAFGLRPRWLSLRRTCSRRSTSSHARWRISIRSVGAFFSLRASDAYGWPNIAGRNSGRSREREGLQGHARQLGTCGAWICLHCPYLLIRPALAMQRSPHLLSSYASTLYTYTTQAISILPSWPCLRRHATRESAKR